MFYIVIQGVVLPPDARIVLIHAADCDTDQPYHIAGQALGIDAYDTANIDIDNMVPLPHPLPKLGESVELDKNWG